MNKGKLKITKEQYNRIFASGLINENQEPKVKGGLTRVDKEFKKAFKGKDVSNIKVTNEEEMTHKQFKFQTPINGMSKNIQGSFDKPLNEGDDKLKQETLDLIKYLYRKSDEFSPFWAEKNLSYDDICDELESRKIIIKKNGGYELSKALGSPEEAIKAVEDELRAMLGNDETPKSDLDEGDWFDNLSTNPANQPDPEYRRGTHIKNPKFIVLSYNGEMALLKGEDGNIYAFYYDMVDRNDFEEYADREIVDRYPDGEGGWDFDYSDDWDVDDDVLQNYINDNLRTLKIGNGLDAWESGDFDLVLVDDELRQDLLDIYDKDANLVKILGGVNESSGDENWPEEWNKFKGQVKQKFTPNPNKGEKSPEDMARIKAKLADIKAKEMARREAEKAADLKFRDEYFKEVDETSSTGSVGGQFTPAMSGAPVIKRQMPDVPVVKEDSDLGAGYTHFAILKSTGQIADGWDYSELYDEYEKKYEKESVREYSKMDLIDNFPENRPSDFKIVTRKDLEKSGINPADTNNWYKPHLNETLDVAGAGNFQYDTPGGLTMDLGKNNPKTKAEKKTQWAGGSFVEFNDCVKLNNKPAGTGCSAGAVDNVVKLKKSKGNVNAPSLGENKIYEAIAKKTGKTIEEVKAIIASKNNKG